MLKFPENTWIVSDLHCQHSNICSSTSTWKDTKRCRQFDSIELMNQAIFNSINQNVGVGDHLVVVGDMFMGKRTLFKEHLSRINCKNLYLVYGNHDEELHKDLYEHDFVWRKDYAEITICGQPIVLFHYPLRSWNHVNSGSWALTGHEHGDMPYPEDWKALDMGWDVWKRPMSFLEIKAIMDKKPIKRLHHNGVN